MASEGPAGRHISCDITSSFGTTDIVVVGHDGLSLGPALKEREPFSTSDQGKGPQKEEKPTHELCGPQQT